MSARERTFLGVGVVLALPFLADRAVWAFLRWSHWRFRVQRT